MKTPFDHLTEQDLKHLLKEQYRNLTESMRNGISDSDRYVIEMSIEELESALRKKEEKAKQKSAN